MAKLLSSLSPRKELVDTDIKDLFFNGNMTIEKLEIIENRLKEVRGDNTIIKNSYAGGVYMRECYIPANTFIIGAVHRDDHISMLVYGSMLVWSEKEGSQRISGFHKGRGYPGVKRVGFAFEDSLYITCHHLDHEPKDEAEIRQLLTYEKYEYFLEEKAYIEDLRKS